MTLAGTSREHGIGYEPMLPSGTASGSPGYGNAAGRNPSAGHRNLEAFNADDVVVVELQGVPSLKMQERVEALDWSAMPLGAKQSWPTSLATALDIALNSRQP